MKNFKFTWKNYGMMRSGYDIEYFSIEIKDSELNPTIKFSTGDNFGFTVVDKTYKLNNKIALKELAEINIPETNTPENGCVGDAWEIEVDGKILKGYIDRPQWLEQIKKIICFKDIFLYVDRKRKMYLEIK